MASLSNRHLPEVIGRGTSDNSLFRCSATELRKLAPAAGIEPATTGLRGEVSVVYATGRIVGLTAAIQHRELVEKSFGAMLIPVPFTSGLRPVPKSLWLAGFPGPATSLAGSNSPQSPPVE